MILDATHFENKPGYVHGMNGSGCIPGAKKLEQWQPSDPDSYHPKIDGDVMIHVEEWTNVPYPLNTKPNQVGGLKVITDLSNRVATKFPSAHQWWYCPPLLRSDYLYAQQGNKDAAIRVKDWRSNMYDLILMGFPGPRFRGVCVDLYDYTYLKDCWQERVKACLEPWMANQRQIVPVLFLRFLDTGALYPSKLARERIEFVQSLCGGMCAIHDGYAAPMRGVFEDYRTWPLKSLIESMARGN